MLIRRVDEIGKHAALKMLCLSDLWVQIPYPLQTTTNKVVIYIKIANYKPT